MRLLTYIRGNWSYYIPLNAYSTGIILFHWLLQASGLLGPLCGTISACTAHTVILHPMHGVVSSCPALCETSGLCQSLAQQNEHIVFHTYDLLHNSLVVAQSYPLEWVLRIFVVPFAGPDVSPELRGIVEMKSQWSACTSIQLPAP